MRRLLVAVAVAATSACSLYFESDPDLLPEPPPDRPDVPFPPIDAPGPDAPPASCAFVAYCGSDGTLYQTPCLAGAPQALPDDVYRRGVAFDACGSGACRDDSTFMVCPGIGCGGAEAELCRPPPVCPVDGDPCAVEGFVARCTEPAGCAVSVATELCTCRDGAYACEPACAGGLCGAADVDAALQGRWIGTVTPPPFSGPYTGTLDLRADHSYAADRSSAGALFYYGGDGTSAVHRWRPIGAGTSGGVATLDVYFGSHSIRTALITDIERDGSSLRFTFWDSWLSCSRPFRFELTAAQ